VHMNTNKWEGSSHILNQNVGEMQPDLIPSVITSYYPAPFSPLSPAHWVTLSFLFFSHPTGTYLTHEAKGSDDAPDADTAIINAEGGHSGAEEKKEYFI
uniref:Uncharacterized protein n=1 Tax=Fundulus heteroclitus TaxID=8078 RepID=A0A3Q2NX64_FUNHE